MRYTKFYLCDPDKNKRCPKTTCLYEKDSNGECFMTTNPDCALAEDGKLPEIITRKGADDAEK